MTDATGQIPVARATGAGTVPGKDGSGKRIRGVADAAVADVKATAKAAAAAAAGEDRRKPTKAAAAAAAELKVKPQYEAKGRGGRATRKTEFATKAHKKYLQEKKAEAESSFVKQADMAVQFIQDGPVVPLVCAFKYVCDAQPLNVGGRTVKSHATQHRIVQMHLSTLDKRRSINVTCRASDLDWTQLTSEQQALVLPTITGLTQTEPTDKALWDLVHSEKRPGGACDAKILKALDDAQLEVEERQKRLDATIGALAKTAPGDQKYDSVADLNNHFHRLRIADREARCAAHAETKEENEKEDEKDKKGSEVKETEREGEVKESKATEPVKHKPLKEALMESALRQQVQLNELASGLTTAASDNKDTTARVKLGGAAAATAAAPATPSATAVDPLKTLGVAHIPNVVVRSATQAVMSAREARMRAMYSALPRLQDEWQRVVNFFIDCGRSVCLLSHNGASKAFKVLQEETLQKSLVWPKSVNFLCLDTRRLYKQLFPRMGSTKVAKAVTLAELYRHATSMTVADKIGTAVARLGSAEIALTQTSAMPTAALAVQALRRVLVPWFVYPALGAPSLAAGVRELFVNKTGPGAAVCSDFKELGVLPRGGALENGFEMLTTTTAAAAAEIKHPEQLVLFLRNDITQRPEFYEALLMKTLGVAFVGMLPIRGASRLILEVDEDGDTKMRIKNNDRYTRGLKHSSYEGLPEDVRHDLHKMVGAYLNTPVDHPRYWQGVIYYSDVRPEGDAKGVIAATATIAFGGLKPEDTGGHSVIMFNLCGNPDLAVSDNVEWLVATVKASISNSFELLDQICAVVHKDDKTVPQALFRLGFTRVITEYEDPKEVEREKHKASLSAKDLAALEEQEKRDGRKPKQAKKLERKTKPKQPRKTKKAAAEPDKAPAITAAAVKKETKTPPPSPVIGAAVAAIATAAGDATSAAAADVPVLPLEMPSEEKLADPVSTAGAAGAEEQKQPREPSAMRLWVLSFESKKARLAREAAGGPAPAAATASAGGKQQPPLSGLAAKVIAAGAVEGLGAKGAERLRNAYNADLFLHIFKLYRADEQFGKLLDFAFSESKRGLNKTTREKLVTEARTWSAQQPVKRVPPQTKAAVATAAAPESKGDSKA